MYDFSILITSFLLLAGPEFMVFRLLEYFFSIISSESQLMQLAVYSEFDLNMYHFSNLGLLYFLTYIE